MHSLANLESVLAQATDGALVVDEAGTVLFATDQACHVLKYAPGELHGLSVELLMPQRFRLAHICHRLRFTDDRRKRPMGAGLELCSLQGWFRAPRGPQLESGAAWIGDSYRRDDSGARVGSCANRKPESRGRSPTT